MTGSSSRRDCQCHDGFIRSGAQALAEKLAATPNLTVPYLANLTADNDQLIATCRQRSDLLQVFKQAELIQNEYLQVSQLLVGWNAAADPNCRISQLNIGADHTALYLSGDNSSYKCILVLYPSL